MKKQSGFGVVEIIVILVLVGVGWLVWQRSQVLQTGQGSTSPGQAKVPDGFKGYANADLGVRFAYPKEWGDVTVVTIAAKTGEKFRLTFSGNSQVMADLETPDFTYNTPGSGYAFTGPGFNGYAQAAAAIQNADALRSQPGSGYSATIFKQSDNHVTYAAKDCIGEGYYIIAIKKLESSKFAGIGFGYYKELQGTDICDDTAEVSKYVDNAVQPQMDEVAKTAARL